MKITVKYVCYTCKKPQTVETEVRKPASWWAKVTCRQCIEDVQAEAARG